MRDVQHAPANVHEWIVVRNGLQLIFRARKMVMRDVQRVVKNAHELD